METKPNIALEAKPNIALEAKRKVAISKKLSYFLRHHLDAIPGANSVDTSGYVLISTLLKMRDFVSMGIKFDEVIEVIEQCEKQRFKLDSTGLKVRANQGHSLKSGELINQNQLLTKLTEWQDYCVHGTTHQAIRQIKQTGLNKMQRTHIHFASKPNAKSGFRSNSKVLIYLDMEKAMKDGIEFFKSDNEVILSPGPIDPKYFKKIEYN